MKEKLSQYANKLINAIKNSPIEIIISLLFLALNVFLYFNKEYNSQILKELSYYYYAFFAISFAMNIIFKSKRIFYYLSALFPIVIYLYLSTGVDFTISLIITTVSAILLIFIAHNEKNNSLFTGKAIVSTLNILISGILTLLSALLIFSIIKSINYIFEINENGHLIYSMIMYAAIYVILPLLFLVLNFGNNNVVKIDRFSEVLVNYILTPALFIYGIILYGYFTKVIILWELPQGVISITAILFLSIGIIVKASRELTDKKILEWFFKYIGYISIPALIMLWVGSTYRVCEYGFTDNRIYLMITVIVLTIWNFAQMFSKTNVYQYLTIMTMALFNITLYFTSDYKSLPMRDSEVNYTDEINNNENYYLFSGEPVNIDISEYSKLIGVQAKEYSSINCYSYRNDTLYFEAKADSLIASVSQQEIIDSIFKDIGADINKLDSDFVDNLRLNPIIFKNDTLTIVIRSLYVEKSKDKIIITEINPELILIK